jgi:[acyl-carrier-protein] S-malonyltransferase
MTGQEQTAVVFPGQGCQRAGMGKDFYEAFPAARGVFEVASDALQLDLAGLCFGDDERLNLTEYAQPAILTTEVAMWRALESEFGVTGQAWGGHSLGEYTALVASGTLDLPTAVRVVRERGRLMQQAVPVGVGGMIALIGDNIDHDRLSECMEGLNVGLANDNAVDQVVVSGLSDHLEKARERIANDSGVGAGRMVDLTVSAPFHSALMKPIEDRFRAILSENLASFDAASATAVTCNASGLFHEGDAGSIIDQLVAQLSNTVRWRDNMEVLGDRCSTILEVGPGRPLRGFFDSIGITASSVTSVRSARRLFAKRATA